MVLPSMSDRKVIGLTGTIGSGKSMVRSILSAAIPVTDCDGINSDLLQKDGRGYLELQKNGLLCVDEHSEIDRPAMADQIFDDPNKRKAFEAILHPLIIDELQNWISEQDGLCAAEVPLLFECHLENMFDEIWTVTCSDQTALERLETQRHISPEEAKRRLALQMSVEQKAAKSDVLIHNDGSVEDLKQTIDALLKKEVS